MLQIFRVHFYHLIFVTLLLNEIALLWKESFLFLDEKISEEHLKGFRDGRREGLRRISKPSYRRNSSASSVERELPFSRRRQDRRADDTPGNHSTRSDSRSGSFSEDRSASGSGKTQMSDNETRKVRCREWSSSDESERSCSTDRMSEQRSLTEYSRKASRLGKTKEEIPREEPATTNVQKSETNRKKKSQVHQVLVFEDLSFKISFSTSLFNLVHSVCHVKSNWLSSSNDIF